MHMPTLSLCRKHPGINTNILKPGFDTYTLSLYLSVVGLYYGITIAIVSFATAMTVLTLNIHHKGLRGKEVPHIIKRIAFGFFAKLLCLNFDSPDRMDPSTVSNISMNIINNAYIIITRHTLCVRAACRSVA